MPHRQPRGELNPGDAGFGQRHIRESSGGSGGLFQESPGAFLPPFPEGEGYPPDRARRALFPAGRGRPRLFFMQGASPLASPGAEPGRRWGEAQRTRPEGGTMALVAGFASLINTFLPLSPKPPSPPGKGEMLCFLMQGASPLASPGLNPGGTGAGAAYHAPTGGAGGAETVCHRAGVNSGLHQQFIREKFLGVWGLLSRSPQRSSFLRSFVFSL